MSTYQQVVREALDNTKVIDPHCHLRPEKPCADNLADILLYHHVWIELVSSGMPQDEVHATVCHMSLRIPGFRLWSEPGGPSGTWTMSGAPVLAEKAVHSEIS
jgi:hypothetical protein